MYGRIASAWKVERGVLTCRAKVPANTEATLYLPAGSKNGVKESGKDAGTAKGVHFVKYESGRAIYRLDSGTYSAGR